MGKMLLVDQILLLAANFKPADYHPATADVRRFLCAMRCGPWAGRR
jgi:hypothetical protein